MKSKGYNNVPVAAAATHPETRAVNKLSLPLDAVFVVLGELDLSTLSDIVLRDLLFGFIEVETLPGQFISICTKLS